MSQIDITYKSVTNQTESLTPSLPTQPGGPHRRQGEGDGRQAGGGEGHGAGAAVAAQSRHRGGWRRAGAPYGSPGGLVVSVRAFLWEDGAEATPQGAVEDRHDHHGEDRRPATDDWQGCEYFFRR